MTEKKEDRRIQRTKSMLIEALLDLIVAKGYEDITVQDLIDRANIGRSTFYSHFMDKEQLLELSVVQLGQFLQQQRGVRTMPQTPGAYRFGFSLAMLQHVQSHKLLYKATVGKQSGARVIHFIQHMLAGLAREEVEELWQELKEEPVPMQVAVDFVVHNLLTLIAWWMDHSTPCPAEEVDRMFHRLTLCGLGQDTKSLEQSMQL